MSAAYWVNPDGSMTPMKCATASTPPADEAYDRLHGADGHTQATSREEPCPACGGSMRFCECMDDPFAPVPSDSSTTNRIHAAAPVDDLCQTCGCGKDGDGDCPCGCLGAVERAREAFALGAAWALGDDEEAPAALRAEVKRLSAERDRYRTAWKSAATRAGIAADQFEQLRVGIARTEALIDAWEHDAPDHTNPVFIGRLREVLRRDPAPIRLRGNGGA